ncbi:MAG: glycosyltransferase family 2 protein [Candidatus Paraimprobicoccus trichonymphae]|uniref:Glycosyltransferase family 2 protein n=1 Tax=Candidatus Paraimprobicoccus trichonymphae TaxID=3033793 RepID=A0AA48IH77_9FIRM|nr:MAG: glycosyltransferase family 2 protein [Candidatus Paraimprobicoccus trichonymphae]
MSLLSIVVPCYNEQEMILLFYEKIVEILNQIKNYINFELIFIDDGSEDNTLELIKNISNKDSNVKYVSFSRNFGKESAIYAGLKKSLGDYVVLIDVDLQDPPELIIKMYDLIINSNYDCVATRRTSRNGEPAIRSFFARLFYKIINKISKVGIIDGARDYRFMTRKMVDSILNLKEYNRFSKGIFSWVGFKTKWLDYKNIKRASGTSKWSFWKLLVYSLDGITAFSTVPLAIASILGIILCFIAFIFICVIIVKTLVWGEVVGGYPTLICTIIFLGGIQLFCIGILGQYISKIYLETKSRPIYIVKEEDSIK